MDQFAKETLPVSLEEEMRRSYLDYAMSVIVGRALPDVRDGLKPVHRRVLFAMHESNNVHNRPYVKCARIVGDVIGKYHPHGDTAVYDTIVRMAQDFSLRHMLVDGQGNFGSVDGDGAAAMRYTECRLDKIAAELLADIGKETVDFQPNYDGKEQEPTVLPSKLPNLLVNGSSGIAVGMATNVPPHNIGEVIDGCLLLLREPQTTVDQLIELIPAPAGTGIVFVRGDREVPVRIAACVENRVDAVQRTTLAMGGVQVQMIEHLMSALAGLGVDCCVVRVSAEEMPGLDGSSRAFVEAVDAAGVEDLGAPAEPIVVEETVRVGDAARRALRGV